MAHRRAILSVRSISPRSTSLIRLSTLAAIGTYEFHLWFLKPIAAHIIATPVNKLLDVVYANDTAFRAYQACHDRTENPRARPNV